MQILLIGIVSLILSFFASSSFTSFSHISPPTGKTNNKVLVSSTPSHVGSNVLGATTDNGTDSVTFNIDAIFNNPTSFTGSTSFSGSSDFTGAVNIHNGLTVNGIISAQNILYGLKAGGGIGVSDGQTPTVTNTGVLTVNGQSGAVTVSATAGDGISVDGLKITNSDKGSTQSIFKTIGVLNGAIGTASGTLTSFQATSNSDTLTFSAGAGVELTPDVSGKKITITTNDPGVAAGWTHATGNVFLTTPSDIVTVDSLNTGYITVANEKSILPSVDLGSDLGSSSHRFNNIYVANINTNSTLSTGGQAKFTYSPTDNTYTESSVIINPTAPATGGYLLGLGVAGYQRAGVDNNGNLSLGYSGGISIPTTTNPLMVYGHNSTNVASVDARGNATLSGSITSNGTGNNYFAGNVGIGINNLNGWYALNVTGVNQGGLTSSINGSMDNGKSMYVENYNNGATQEYGIYSWVNPANTTAFTASGLFAAQPQTAAAGSQSYGVIGSGRARAGPAGSFGIGGYFKAGAAVLGNPSITLTKSVGLIADVGSDQNGTNNIFEGRYSGAVKFLIDGSGNVGIGTTNPGTKLEVSGGLIRARNGLDIDADTKITGNYSANGNYEYTYLNMYNSANASINIGTRHGAGYISFESGNGAYTERMRITNTGNVGIGTTNPGYALDVSGSMRTGGFLYLPGRPGGIIANGTTIFGYDQNGVGNNKGYVGTQTATDFYMETNAAARMVILANSGNVGINTISPLAPLHVAGAYAGNAATIIDQLNGGDIFTASASGITKFVIANNGNVGIGATPTTAKLQVAGGVNLTGINPNASSFTVGINSTIDGYYGAISLSNYGGGGVIQTAGGGSGNDLFFKAQSTGAQHFFTNGTEKLTILNGGNVGIGTTNPGSALDIVGGIHTTGYIAANWGQSSNQMLLGNGAVYGGDLRQWGLLGGAAVGGGAVPVKITSGTTATAGFTNGSITLGRADANQFFLNTDNGFVGIGTTNPGAGLDVQTNGGGIILNAGPIIAYGGFVTMNGNIQFGSSSRQLYWSNSTLIKAPSDGKLVIENNAGTGFNLLQLGGTTSSFPALAVSGSDLQVIRADGSTNANLLVSGNVGIGTTNPTSVLTVNGDIRVMYPTDTTKYNTFSNDGTYLVIGKNGSGAYVRQDNKNWTLTDAGFQVGGIRSFNWSSSGYDATASKDLSLVRLNPATLAITNGTNLEGGITGYGTLIASNVGIGTTNPISSLHVVGTYGGNAAAIINQLNSGDIFTASASGTTKFVLTNAGRVGIGVVSPVYNLDINGGNNSATTAQFAASYHNGIQLTNGGDSYVNSISFYQASNSRWAIGNIPSAAAGGDFAFQRLTGSTTTPLVIKGDTGNVGIGTTSPGGLLDVAQSSTNKTGIRVTGTGYSGGTDVANGVGMYLGYNSSGNRQTWLGATDAIGSTTLGMFRYQTGTAGYAGFDAISGNGSNRLLTIAASETSNFGVGYTSTGVDITQYTAKLNAFTYNTNIANLNLRQFGTAAGNFLEMRNNAGTILDVIDTNGNLGIGTTNPGSKLTVAGSISVQDEAVITGGSSNPYLKFSNANGITMGFNNDVTRIRLENTGSMLGGISFQTNSLSRMLIDFSGNVGIGTSSPNSKMHLYDSDGASLTPPQFIAQSTSATWTSFFASNTYGNAIHWSSNKPMRFGTSTSNTGSGFSNLMQINADGTVGIGTVQPLSKLGILGNLSVGATYGIYAAPASGMIVEGNVGIGTTAPAAKFHLVSNNTGLAELIQATASHSGNLVEIQDSSNQKLLEISNSGDIVINAYNTASTNERNLSFVRYGAVGNTTNPKFQLGRVIAGGINVPEIRFMYSDLNETERSVFEIENTGTIGSVKPCTSQTRTDCWGSHYEGFMIGDIQPVFRLQSNWLEFGPGGNTSAPDIRFTRAGTNSLALWTTNNSGGGGANRLIVDGNGAVMVPGIGSYDDTRPALTAARMTGEIAGISTSGSLADQGFLRLSAGGGSAVGARSFIDLSGYSTVSDMYQNIVLGTSGSEKMRLTSNGRVGIGTTNPQSLLDVNGSVRLGSALGANDKLNTSAGSAPSGNLYWGDRTVLDSSNYSSYTGSNLLSSANTWTNTQTYNNSLYLPGATSDINTARPAISASRVVGEISGTSNAGASSDAGFLRLSAGGGTAANARSYIDLSGYSTVSDMNQNIIFGVSGVEKMRVTGSSLTSSGLLGIGTTSPNVGNMSLKADIVGSGNTFLGVRSYSSSAGTAAVAGIRGIGARNTEAAPSAVAADDQLLLLSATGYASTGWINASKAGIVLRAAESWTGSANGTYIDFSTTALGSTSKLEAMRINPSGNLGVGTSIPGYKLQVGNAGDGTEARANAWNSLSDLRFKENVTPISNALNKIMSLDGVSFNWKSTGKASLGLIAQDVLKVFPELVSTDDQGILSLNYAGLSAPLIQAIKEQQTQINELQVSSSKFQVQSPNDQTITNLTLQTLAVSGGVTFKSTVDFAGQATFNNLVDFFGTVVTHARVYLSGGVTFDSNTGGTAIISAYSDHVDVHFAQAYEVAPIVTTTLTLPDSADKTFIDMGVQAVTTKVTKDGFTILLPTLAARDFTYHWIAIAVKDSTVTKSPSPIGDIIGAQTATPSATITPTVSITSEASPSAALSITPTP